jgi:hypothetical protein
LQWQSVAAAPISTRPRIGRSTKPRLPPSKTEVENMEIPKDRVLLTLRDRDDHGQAQHWLGHLDRGLGV